jgi:hypothetical protein
VTVFAISHSISILQPVRNGETDSDSTTSQPVYFDIICTLPTVSTDSILNEVRTRVFMRLSRSSSFYLVCVIFFFLLPAYSFLLGFRTALESPTTYLSSPLFSIHEPVPHDRCMIFQDGHPTALHTPCIISLSNVRTVRV